MHCLAAKGSLPGDTNWFAQFLLIFFILVVCEAWEEFWGFECDWYDGLLTVKIYNWWINTLILIELGI